ncbi:MAG: TCR/Tet family MFS transporter [Deltaproteobacteria bacterium]|nr:TCR/Tet family MFS transporter [Deltaproteobacteria bacterium]
MNQPLAAPSTPVRKAALAFIFVTVVLDMLALGIIVPVLPMLVLQFEGGNSASAATIFGVFSTVFAAMQFLFSPFLGALSDRFGRRPVVLISNLGLGLDYIVMAAAPSVYWLLLGRTISGICAATFSTAGAYIADVTPPEKRAGSFGMLSAAFGLGFVIGPAVGGLLGAVSPRLPFWVAAALSLSNACYGLFVLPESLPADRRATFDWKRANPLGALGLLRQHAEVFGIAGVVFLAAIAHEVQPTMWVLYTDYRYGWDTRTVGLTLAAVGILSAVVGGGLVRVAVRRLGERNCLLTGLLFGSIGFAIFGFAPTGSIFCAGLPVLALWGLSGPAAQSLMTQRIDPSEQGRLQGAVSGLQGVAYMIGPGLFTTTFAASIGDHARWHQPGSPFLLAALFLAAAFALAWAVARR